MSSQSRFHTTPDLLIEREQLHQLVDFFWQVLPNTRDEIYRKMSAFLCVDDAHISDLDSQQIRIVASKFQKELKSLAPCSKCKYHRQTSYGILMCNHRLGCGAFWQQPESKLGGKCKYYVSRHLSVKRRKQSRSRKKDRLRSSLVS